MMIKGLVSDVWGEAERAETVDSRREGLPGGSGMHINIWQKTVKKMETDFSVVFQWRNKRQQAQTEIQEIHFKPKKKSFLQWGLSSTEQAAQRILGISNFGDIQTLTGQSTLF